MKRRFDLLVLPHHTQVICLLVFRSFLESKRAAADHAHALIAQVGTGEGKSGHTGGVLPALCTQDTPRSETVDLEKVQGRVCCTSKACTVHIGGVVELGGGG